MKHNLLTMIKQKIFAYPFEISVVGLGAIGYIFYISTYFYTEFLGGASFQGDVQLVEKLFSETLSTADMMRRFGEHGMLGYNFLLIINALLFKYNSHFDTIVNCVNVLLCGSFLAYCIQKEVDRKAYLYYVGFVLAMITMFSTMQGSAGTMETQVRLGLMFFIFSSYFVSEIIVGATNKYDLYYALALVVLSINVFGTLYIFAGVPVVFLMIAIATIRNRALVFEHGVLAATYVVAAIIYIFGYGLMGASGMGAGSLLQAATFWVSHPIGLFQYVCAYYGSTLLGFSALADKAIETPTYLAIGFLLSCIYLYSIVLFVKTKMYEKTVMPILLQGYSFFVVVMLLLGRWQQPMGGAAEWYHVHTKVGLVACIWILIYALAPKTEVNSMQVTQLRRNLGITSFTVILIGLFIGVVSDLKRAPHALQYYKNVARYMHVDEGEISINAKGDTPLFADLSSTVNGLRTLRKYKLSVFRHSLVGENPVERKPGRVLTNTSPLLRGAFSTDGWIISREIELEMNTGGHGRFSGTLYFPSKHYVPNGIRVFVNGQLAIYKEFAVVGSHSFEGTVEANKNVKISIIMDKALVPKKLGINDDQRELSAVLSDFHFE